MAQQTTEKLADLIGKRHACLQQLRDVGEKQSELIAAGDMGALLRLLSAKNQLLAVLQAIEKELAPYHDQDPESRLWPTPSHRIRCADQAAQCRTLLEEVMQLERNNEQRMTVRRDEVASQLQQANAASRASGAYQVHQASSPKSPHIPMLPMATEAAVGYQLDIQSKG